MIDSVHVKSYLCRNFFQFFEEKPIWNDRLEYVEQTFTTSTNAEIYI